MFAITDGPGLYRGHATVRSATHDPNPGNNRREKAISVR
jgi:hypothetical protein